MVPPLSLRMQFENSCNNWLCCCCPNETPRAERPVEQNMTLHERAVSETETIERTTIVYHRHVHGNNESKK